jgi:uncharacterized protein
MIRNGLYPALICLALASYQNCAEAASFNCGKARSTVELAICSDPELNKLDELLAISYKTTLELHPAPNYIKARQADWVNLNNYCDHSNFVGCLKDNYVKQISLLMGRDNLVVFSNSTNFSYEHGDAIVEYWKSGDGWRLSVWGGFVIHELATEEQGHSIFTGCEFEGWMPTISDNESTAQDGRKLRFRIAGRTLTFDDSSDICSGYGRLPDTFRVISR